MQEGINKEIKILFSELYKVINLDDLSSESMVSFGIALQKCRTTFLKLVTYLGYTGEYRMGYAIDTETKGWEKIEMACPYCNSSIYDGKNKRKEDEG